MKLTPQNRMYVAAHRGDSYNYYENTKTAFEMATLAGADMIETDVHLTLDNKLVLIHDDTVDRTTNGHGRVSEMTFDEIQGLNAGDKTKPEKIPTLEELLEWAIKKDITINIEIKEYYKVGNEERAKICIESVIELIEKYKLAERVVINSFDGWVLEYVYKKYGKKYLLHGFYPYNEMFNVSIDPTTYLDCACIFDNQKKEHYDFLINNGIEPWIGASVTQISKLTTCLNYGAKLITTNYPRDIVTKLEGIENKNG